ncbi:GNAT family N-acetyltransferase [Haloferax sp. MBLA0076]|uniref:GNAT family N-acetyltransferase n=1 Tax=Haloferax litoreum TaxID=2666140 RepID=A0A6A8GIR0_9EURY|nr:MULTISPECIES: GNAT family protein [Haloferax]KAB1194199.1 GNAT family N-acetyltransferase [Haloferax sp. CBA1148]MRX22759.1 GNAT family N-acetyltransferase [Haloferax litoreum]
MTETTVVESDRVALRPVERDDAALLQRSTTDPDIRVPLGAPAPQNHHQATEFIEQTVEEGDNIAFVAEVEGDAIGFVMAEIRDYGRPELVYWLLPEYHGQGYGTDAVGCLVDYLFRTVECHGLQAITFEFNEASRGVLERLGFVNEGQLREAAFIDGSYVDVVRFGLLRREWEENQSD